MTHPHGPKIKAARLHKGLTRAELADLLPGSRGGPCLPATVGRWENGHTMPHGSRLRALESLLGLSLRPVAASDARVRVRVPPEVVDAAERQGEPLPDYVRAAAVRRAEEEG